MPCRAMRCRRRHNNRAANETGVLGRLPAHLDRMATGMR